MTGESKSLPIEVLDRIFRHLPRKSLVECQSVCQLWYPIATRHIISNVTFRKLNKINRFLNCQPRLSSLVKKMEIDTDNQVTSRTIVKKMMLKVPNLQELVIKSTLFPFHHLKYINSPTSLTSISFLNYLMYTTQNVDKLKGLLARFRNTIQKFTMVTYYGVHQFDNSWDVVSFIGTFPKLTELDLRYVAKLQSFADWLPIIQANPSLKSIRFENSHIYDISPDFNNTNQFKQRLSELEKLEFKSSSILPYTLSFIIHNLLGLKEINVIFSNEDTDYEPHISTVLLKFLNFIYSIDKYEFKFSASNEFFLHCLSDMISNSFNQLPENSQNVSRQLYIVVNYSFCQGDYLNHSFQLESDRDYCNRLRRKIKWSINYDRVYRNDLLKCIAKVDKINADIFVFDMSENPPTSRCFDVFFECLSLLVEPTRKIVLRVSIGSELFKYQQSKQLDHITQLEIQVIVERETEKNCLALFSDTLTNLKTLRLIYLIDNDYHYPKNEISSLSVLDFPLLNIETLYLDVSLLVHQAKTTLDERFLLVIETSTLLHRYCVSMDSLNATKISQFEPENHEITEFYITIQSLQNIHLQASENMVELDLENLYNPFPPSYFVKETLISL